MDVKKIAFIKIGHFSFTNEKILDELRNNFPRHQIEIIDIWEHLVRPGDLILPPGLLFGVRT